LVQQKDATIEGLRERNTWLKEQVDQAKDNAPDILVKTLSENRTILETELKRLSKDRETNRAEIKNKEAELIKTKDFLTQLQKAIDEFREKYDELRDKVDLCPYCEAGLVELKDVHEEDWVGSHRKYACGYTILDGERIYFCPSDPEYPNFEDEFEVEYQGRIMGDGWTCYFFPKTAKARMVEQIKAFGKTQESALQNLKEEYYRNPSKTETDSPTF
jgi:uncharacterized protein with PIN domain